MKNLKNTPAPDQQDFYDIPLLGQVRLEATSEYGGDYNLGELLNNFRKNAAHAITMQAMDHGLTDHGILRGDLLTIDLRAPLNNGDICAIHLGHKTYIRKVYFEKNFIRFEGNSTQNSPLIVDPRTPGFELIGKVTAVIREL